MDIGVRELKQHLSEYLERAARGETIRVTDRGAPKAILGPIPGAGRLEQGIAEGWIHVTEDIAPVPAQRARAEKRTEDVLRDDRNDR